MMNRYKMMLCRLASLLVLMTGSLTVLAQNTLQVTDFTAAAGKEVAVPIYLDNSQDIVGMQFNITLPYAKGNSGVTLVDARSNGHSVSLRKLSNTQYTVVVMSMENKPLRGNAGLILRFPVKVPDTAQADDTVPFGLSAIVLTDKNGHNIATETTSDATFTVLRTPTPDFTLSDLTITNDGESLVPSGNLRLHFTVANQGTGASTEGWTEKIYLEDVAGTRTFVASQLHTATLAAGEQEERSYEVTLPQVLKMDGTVFAYIELIPKKSTDELIADQGNNNVTSSNTKELEKRLFFSADREATTTRIVLKEGNKNADWKRVTLTRSGDWSMDETYTISEQNTHGETMLSVPQTVTIRKGYSGVTFTVRALNNNEVNTQYRTGITATGNDYPPVDMIVDVEDDDNYPLTLTTDKGIYQEGDELTLTATIGSASETDLKVTITNTDAGRFYPYVRSITIPAGQLSASATTQVVDDSYVTTDANITFTATATGYETSKRTIALQDNDWPQLSVSLSRTLISEGEGYGATMATITRTGNLNSNITIYVTSNAGQELFYDSQYNIIPAGQSSITIPISVEDNSQIEGQRTWTVTFAACDAYSGKPVGQGHQSWTSTQLTVTDDDADVTLKLQANKATLAEGGNAVTVTVERNGTVGDQVVTLTSDDDYVQMPSTVTIANGQNSATFSVRALTNLENNDNHYARITASADGAQSAQYAFFISTLPDAVCGTPVLSDTNPFGGQTINVTLPIANRGTSELEPGMSLSIRLTPSRNYVPLWKDPDEASPEHEVLFTRLTESVPAGETVSMTFPVTLPTHLKEQQLYVVALLNHKLDFAESDKHNGVSPTTPITIQPSFVLSAISTDRDIYTRGNTIRFTGQMTNAASGLPMNGREVDVFLLNDTKRYQVTTTLDAQGNFAAEYTFGEQAGGRYRTGACVHGTGRTDTDGHIDVTRLRIDRSGYLMQDITESVPLEGNIGVTNLSEVPAYNISFRMDGLPEDWTVEMNSIATLLPGAAGYCHYRIISTKPSSTNKDFKEGNFVVSSIDGNGNTIADSEMPVYFWNYPAKAALAANDVRTTLYKDGERTLHLKIENGGIKETGAINVAWATDQQWFSAATTQLASIAAGGSTTLELRLKGQPGMQIDGTYGCTLRLRPENGDKLDVNIEAKVVSTDKGQLTVDIIDAYTLGADDGNGPHVGNATVKVANAFTGEMVMTGTTDSNGLFVIDNLKEGTYTVYATAADHYFKQDTVLINAAEERTKQLFLPYKAVKIEYTVERTTVVDEYRTVLSLDIVPDIPQAIVIPDLPGNWGTGTHAYSIRLTNKGRLTAYTPYLEFPNVKDATFTVVSDYPAVIYPNESFDVTVEFSGPEYVYITKLGAIKMHYAYKLQGETYWSEDSYCCAMGTGELVFDSGSMGGASADHEGKNFGTYVPPLELNGYGGDLFLFGDDSGLDSYEEKITVRDYSNAVDNRVRLQFEQKFFLEREAFKGSLTIENQQMNGIEHITMIPNVKRTDGTDASDLFAIEVTSDYSPWRGSPDNWQLASSEKGTAKVLYVPSKETAPTEPVEYLFGGTVTYRDVETGNLITVELTPTLLSVNPSPDLHLTYFVQRDFISDDPLTDEVEPWEPAQFALLIQNKGAGDAINLKIETGDPTIVQNDCGLPINFIKLYCTVDGQTKNMEFNKLDLGRIAAGQNVMARWWYYSTVSAHVANYEVQMTKHSNYGVEFDLISIDGVRELTHSVSGTVEQAGASSRRQAFSPTASNTNVFLLNTIQDEDNLPDHVIDQNGVETDDLEIVSERATIIPASNEGEYVLSMTASREGWVYGIMHDPTNCSMNLVRAVRNSDGADVTQNIWQTDRTVTSDYTTIVDNRLHWADNIDTEESYTLYYEAKPAAAPQVKSITLLAEEGKDENKATRARITFTDAIDAESFDADDIVMQVGHTTYNVTVTPESDRTFVVDWDDNVLLAGSAVLTVFTSGIKNLEGTTGTDNKLLRWTAAVDYEMGDANGDRKVNITDTTILKDHILDKKPAGFVIDAADMDGNGVVNITDLTLLKDKILGK